MNAPLNGVTALTHWGVIRAQGEDAAKFLHGQLTNDVVLLDATHARLAGFCSAKGRLQASFIVFKRSPTDLVLLCNRDLLTATLKRLSLFVLRAKVTLSDASAQFAVYGLAGSAMAQTGQPPSSDAPWSKSDIGAAAVVSLYPADGVARALWVAPTDTPPPAGEPLPLETWQWGEVRSGVASVTQVIVDLFVPQMLNYESVGGVNFKKGCYPGQEVVARSQFRGTLKRRAYLAHAASPLHAGMNVFVSADDQPCGTVAQAAPSPAGGFDAIVSMQISAFESGQVFAGSLDGPALQLSAAPYPLLADL